MKLFSDDFFEKFVFSPLQIRAYFASAERNLKIAASSDFSEVTFKFSYDALIKIGIALIAMKGYRVKSVMGHHINMLEALASLLNDPEIEVIGNIMRRQRNMDLYDEGLMITQKQADEYRDFVQRILKKARTRLIEEKSPLFKP